MMMPLAHRRRTLAVLRARRADRRRRSCLHRCADHELIGDGPFGYHLVVAIRPGRAASKSLRCARCSPPSPAWLSPPRWRALSAARARRALSAPSFRRSADAHRHSVFRDPDRPRRRSRGASVRPRAAPTTCATIFGFDSPASCCGAWAHGRLSAFGFGSLKILRLYTLLLAVPAIRAPADAAQRVSLAAILGARRIAKRMCRRARRMVSLSRRAHQRGQRFRSLVVRTSRRFRARRGRLGVQVARPGRAGQLLPETLRAAADSGQRTA